MSYDKYKQQYHNILAKSEEGKDGMTVVNLGYVYTLIDNYEAKLEKLRAEIKQLKGRK